MVISCVAIHDKQEMGDQGKNVFKNSNVSAIFEIEGGYFMCLQKPTYSTPKQCLAYVFSMGEDNSLILQNNCFDSLMETFNDNMIRSFVYVCLFVSLRSALTHCIESAQICHGVFKLAYSLH